MKVTENFLRRKPSTSVGDSRSWSLGPRSGPCLSSVWFTVRIMQYRSTRKAVFSVKYHVIWCPNYRRRVRGGERRLKQIIDEVVAEFDGMAIELETMPNHVHLLVELPPQVAVSKLVQILKGRSSHRLRQGFPHLAPMKCLWSPSWFVSTIGGAPLEVVRRYAEKQELAAARKTKAA